MTTADSIRPTLQAALAPSALVLEDVAVTPAGRRRVVKVLVDRALDDAGLETRMLLTVHDELVFEVP
ncbi:MAG TPA: hypothetical protein VNN23_09695, partial [Ornithinibacter sp.]|nr:hypothetical protein [Ornithinibacter sp.]